MHKRFSFSLVLSTAFMLSVVSCAPTTSSMPDEALTTKPTVARMKVGEVLYVNYAEVSVDLEGNAFIAAETTFVFSEGDSKAVRVELREDGYHVFTSPQHRWEPHKIDWMLLLNGYFLPIAEIHVQE